MEAWGSFGWAQSVLGEDGGVAEINGWIACPTGGIDVHDFDQSVLSLVRHGGPGEPAVAVVLNFTPIPRSSYRIGVPAGGFWREALNSDATEYGGGGWGNLGGVEAAPVGSHGFRHSVHVTVPALGAVYLVGP